LAPRRSTRIAVTGAPSAFAMSLARRREKSSLLGFVLAVVALLAQIAGPGIHAPISIGPADGTATLAAFGAHALCLASDSAAPVVPSPAKDTPEPHHDFAACCFWHASTGAALALLVLAEPVAFASLRVGLAAPFEAIPTYKSGTARARAPPVGA
jgi:hypothetical protein